MRLTNRVKALESALAKKNGQTGYKLVVRTDGESDNEARKRAGLAEWPGMVFFITEEDVLVL